jgi:hypothetical protein
MRWAERSLVPAARPCAATAAAFARLVAVAAKHRTVTAGLEGDCGGLAATRTNHRSSLGRSGTVPASATPAALIVLLGLAAGLAALRSRITAFLKKCLIGSGEGKILPAIAACELNISSHGLPRVEIVRHKSTFSRKDSY